MKAKKKKTSISPSVVFVAVSFVTIVLVIVMAVLLFNSRPNNPPTVLSSQVEIVDGVQIAEIYAKNGFTPGKLTLKSDTVTKLRITTKDTVDCSNVISIPKIQIQRNLPVTGTTDVEIPPQSTGTKLTATCSLGQNTLQLEFV